MKLSVKTVVRKRLEPQILFNSRPKFRNLRCMKSRGNKFVSNGNTFEFLPKKPIESGITDKERILLDLMNGQAPKNDHERKLLKQIEQIKKQKLIVDIPSDFL